MRSERSPGRLCSANDHHPGPARSRKKHFAVSCIWSRHQVPVTFSNYERGLTPNFAWIDPVTTGTRDLKKRHESVFSANNLAYGPLETINVLDRSSGSVIAHPMATPTQLKSSLLRPSSSLQWRHIATSGRVQSLLRQEECKVCMVLVAPIQSYC